MKAVKLKDLQSAKMRKWCPLQLLHDYDFVPITCPQQNHHTAAYVEWEQGASSGEEAPADAEAAL